MKSTKFESISESKLKKLESLATLLEEEAAEIRAGLLEGDHVSRNFLMNLETLASTHRYALAQFRADRAEFRAEVG